MTQDDSPPPDPLMIDALEREIPGLMRLRRFAMSLERTPWFVNVGERPSPAVRAIARDLCDALGFPDADVAQVVDWEEAAVAAENLDFNAPFWEAEELLRADATEIALQVFAPEGLEIGLKFVSSRASEVVESAAAESAAIWDETDRAALRAAQGEAIRACHGAALVLAAAEADPELDAERHPLALKFQLFELGRWPIGVAGATFNYF